MVAVTSREENDSEDDVPEDKGSKSVVEGVKDGDEKEEDDDEVKNRIISKLGLNFES